MTRYLQWVLGHRGAVLVVTAVITLLAGYSLTNGVVASSVIRLFFGDSAKYKEYRALADEFAGNDVMVFAFDDPSVFTPEGAKRLTAVARDIRKLSYIKRVDGLDSLSRVTTDGEDIVIEPYVDRAKHGNLLEELRADPLASGWMVSPHSTATAVIVELAPDNDRPIEIIPKLLAEILSKFDAHGIDSSKVHMAGVVPESAEATKQARFTLSRLFPITVLLLALVVYVLFLRIWPVIITGGVALISIVWTFGLSIAIDPEVNLLMAMVPGMITVIAFSDIIHLYSAFVRKCELGTPKQQAVLESGTEVGIACFFTSLTTFVGFASLVFIPTPVIRQLGVILGVGVGIALLLALTLVPVVLSMVPGIEAGTRSESTIVARILDVILGFSQRVSTGYPKAVVAGFFVTIGVCIYGMSQLVVETSFAQRLDRDNEIRVAQRFISERFAAANFLDIYVLAPEGKDLLDPETFKGIAKLQQEIAADAGADSVLSIVDLVRVLHRAMTGAEGLPDKREQLAQYLLLFEVSGGEGLGQLINDERNKVRMTVRLKDDGLRGLADFGDRMKVRGDALLNGGGRVLPTGVTYLLGDWITFTLNGQRQGLLFAVLSTTLMMILCLRSWRVGIVSMLPNLLPLMVLGGFCGLVWPWTDSDTILVAIFAIGMAVDDTIHFLTRLKHDTARHETQDEALSETFSFTGRAIVQTTIILCLGFLPFAASDYFSTKIVGTLLPMCLIVALVADLLLVPALVRLGWLRFGSGRT